MPKTPQRTPATTDRPLQRPRIQLNIDAPTFTAGKLAREDFDNWTIQLLQKLVNFANANRSVPGGVHSAGFIKQPGKKTQLVAWLWSARDKMTVNKLRRKDKSFENLPPQSDYKELTPCQTPESRATKTKQAATDGDSPPQTEKSSPPPQKRTDQQDQETKTSSPLNKSRTWTTTNR